MAAVTAYIYLMFEYQGLDKKIDVRQLFSRQIKNGLAEHLTLFAVCMLRSILYFLSLFLILVACYNFIIINYLTCLKDFKTLL